MILWHSVLANIIQGVIIGTLALYLATKIAKIDNATIIRAFVVALVDSIVINIPYSGFTPVSTTGILLIIAVGILTLVLIKMLYEITWLKAFITLVLYAVLCYVIWFVVFTIIFGCIHLPDSSLQMDSLLLSPPVLHSSGAPTYIWFNP